MTHDDAFDARLRAAFARAEASVPRDDGFADRVIARVRRPRRVRALVIAGAGSIGAMIAGSQISAVTAALTPQSPPSTGALNPSVQSALSAAGDLSAFAALGQPHVLVAGVMALMALTVAGLLPERR